ncbi:hypothetical protein Tco_1386186 [Tanacetum coccineum]
MVEHDWSNVERTQVLIDYVYAKYENIWKESDEAIDEMLDDLYNFAMMKEKYLSMVESEKGKAKLMVSDEMVECVLAKYGKNWNLEDEVVDVILEDLHIKYEKGKEKVDDLQNRVEMLKGDLARAIKAKQAKHDKGKAKQAQHDLDALDLENRIKKL